MKLLAFLESIKPLNEGILNAMIDSAVPTAIDTLRDEMLAGNDSGVTMELFRLHEYGDPHEEPDDTYENIEAKYAEWLDEWSDARVENAAYNIANGMKYDAKGIIVYRVIKADKNFPSQIASRGLGEYWSWNAQAAEAHWAGDGNIEYEIEGRVSPQAVDWEHSLFQNAHPSYDHEAEIYIPQGSDIELISLMADGDEVHPDLYGGQNQMLAASRGARLATLTEAVKLRGFGPSSASDKGEAFMRDFEAATKPTPNPVGGHGRLYGNVLIDVSPWGQNEIHLGDINVIDNRGRGQGTKALDFLKGLADKHGVELTGIALAYDSSDHEGSTEELFKWYSKRGFTGTGSGEDGYNIRYNPMSEDIEHDARFARLSMLREDDGRLARARAMGFDTSTVWYHGTNADVHSFKGDLGVAAHLTRGADTASEWAAIRAAPVSRANTTSIYPVFIRVKNVFDLRRDDHQNMIDFLEYDEDYNFAALEKYIPQIIAAGFDAYWDYEDANDLDNEDNIAIVDAKNIRSVHAQFNDSNSNNLLASIGESAGGQFVYHATMAKNLGGIMGKGLTMFNDSLWKKAGTGERYQEEPSVFAFEHPVDAFRWAHKIEWEYKTPAVVVKLKRGPTWGRDPSEDIALQMSKGNALVSNDPIPASDVVGAKTLDQIGTPRSTGLRDDEFDQHVVDVLT